MVSLFEEFIATQEEMKASRFPIYKVSKREDWLTGSSNRPPPNLSLFVRLPKKMEKKEGVKRKHLPIVAIDCEMVRAARQREGFLGFGCCCRHVFLTLNEGLHAVSDGRWPRAHSRQCDRRQLQRAL